MRLARRRAARAAPALAVALAAGAAWGLQFGREGYLLAPWVALAPLLLLLSHRRAVGLAFLHGLAAWLVGLYWIPATLETFGELGSLAALGGLLLLAAYLAAYTALFAWLGRPLWRRLASPVGEVDGDRRPAATGRGPAWVGTVLAAAGLPALWVALEWVRGHLIEGFPWNLAAYAWVEVPGALPATSWIGAYGLSGVVVAANLGAAVALARRRWEPLALGVMAALVLLAAAGRWGGGQPVPAGGGQAMRIVQPNIENLTTFDTLAVQRNYAKLMQLSSQACDRPGALLLWPESAAWPFSFEIDPAFRADVEALAARCPVLLNAARQDAGRWFNSAYLVAPGAPPARYDKRTLVPFGEYVPFRGIFPGLDTLARNAGEFTPAEELSLLPWGEEVLGPAICFEVTFPAEVAATVRAGATVLVTVTNDAWYGDTTAPWQHFRAARFRAAENRRPLLRAAITGVSGVIAPDGSVRGELGVGEEGLLRLDVVGRRDLSPFSRWPDLVPLASAVFAVFAIFWSRPTRSLQHRGRAPLPKKETP